MSLPYPPPERVRTTKRCQFSLPGRRYDCRRVGAYVLNGKHYCAPHYDTTWKVQNPLYGQRHDWHTHVNKFTGQADKYETCRRCGVIRVYEGLPQRPCEGHMPEIVLW